MNRRAFLASTLSSPLLGASTKVAVDPDGMLSINGRRTFVLGTYSLPKVTSPWKEVHEAGLNVVHVGGKPEELQLAKTNGLNMWVTLGSIDPAKRAQDEARIRKQVDALKGDPALLFWETEDEPAYIWNSPGRIRVPAERIIETYSFVKRFDPAHPFYLNHAPANLVSTLQKYNEGTDIVATDIYPVIPPSIPPMYGLFEDGRQGDFLNNYISQVGQYTRKMRQVAGPSRAVFMVLQAFAWEDLRKEKRDPKLVLFPTRDQLRFMAYQAIVNGANGLLYWGLEYAPAAFWADLKKVLVEVSSLGALLTKSPDKQVKVSYHDLGHSIDLGLEWRYLGGTLLVVNGDPNTVEATLDFAGKTVRETFAPFSVKVFTK